MKTRDIFAELKSKCNTKSKRIAFNQMIKAFANDPVITLQSAINQDMIIELDKSNKDFYNKDLEDLIKKTLGDFSKVYMLNGADIENGKLPKVDNGKSTDIQDGDGSDICTGTINGKKVIVFVGGDTAYLSNDKNVLSSMKGTYEWDSDDFWNQFE